MGLNVYYASVPLSSTEAAGLDDFGESLRCIGETR